MKQIKRLIFIFAITFIVGCAKDETFTEQSLPKTDSSTKVDFMLGRKIENAYSVKYMQQAYDVLVQQGEISELIDIVATHWYIKLSPQDTTEMNCILADTVLELFPYPLDYELIGEGEYVVEENTTPDLYTVIPVDHNLDGRINFEILEECFIPEDYDENPDLAKLELTALYLSGNITKEQIEQEVNAKASWWKKPNGYVTVKNTSSANTNHYEAVRGVKVRVHNIVKISSMYTNSGGYYSSTKSFLTDVHYSAVFENNRGFKVWSNLGPLSPAIHNVGWHSKSGYNIAIGENSCAWPWATINNAALDYYNVICPQFNISQPYNGLRIWYLSGVAGNIIEELDIDNWEGSAPMLRKITLDAAYLAEYLFILGLLDSPALAITTASVYGVMLCMPDVFITEKNRNTNDLRRVIFHELSHASHFTEVGSLYWVQYIYQICYNVINSSGGNAYGSEQNEHNNIVGVGEMWASYFEYKCTEYYGYNYSFPDTDEWYAPQILQQIEENGDGITPQKIYNTLEYHVQSHEDLKQKLIYKYGQEQIINQAFADGGF